MSKPANKKATITSTNPSSASVHQMETLLKPKSPQSHPLLGKLDEVAALTNGLAKRVNDIGYSNPQKHRANVLNQYDRAINDNFEYSSPPLGFDTFRPPQRGRAFIKKVVATNATDGSCTVFAIPNINNLMAFNGGLFASQTDIPGGANVLTYYGATNATALATSVIEARPLSLNMEIYMDTPATGLPGMVSCACINPPPYSAANNNPILPVSDSTLAGVQTTTLGMSTSTVYQIASGKTSSAIQGCRVVWKPQDLENTMFYGGYATGPADSPWNPGRDSSYTWRGPILYAAFNGCPPNGGIFVNIMYEFEYYTDSGTGSVDLPNVNDMARTHFTKDDFYSQLLARPEKASPLKAVARGMGKFFLGDLGETIVDGVWNLFGTDHTIERRGRDYYAVGHRGRFRLSDSQVNEYFQHKAAVELQHREQPHSSHEKSSSSTLPPVQSREQRMQTLSPYVTNR